MGTRTTNLNLYAPAPAETGWALLVNGNWTTIDNLFATDGKLLVTSIHASGTPSSSTFLRGDGSWATVSGFNGTYSGTTGINLTDTSSTGILFTEKGSGGMVVLDSGGGGVTVAAEPSGSLPTIRQQSSVLHTSAVSSFSFSYASPVMAGNQLVFLVGLDGTATAPTSLTDNQGVIWTKQTFFIGSGDSHGFTLYTGVAVSTSTLTVSMTFATTTNVAVLWAEIEGADGVEQVLVNTSTGTTWSSQSLTTRVTNELLLAFDVAYGPPASLTDSFTELQSQTLPANGTVQIDMATKNAPSIAAYTSSWTQAQSHQWHTIIMSYPYGDSVRILAQNQAMIFNGVLGTLGVTNSGSGGTQITDAGGGGIVINNSNLTSGGIFIKNQSSALVDGIQILNSGTPTDAGNTGTFIHDTSGNGIYIRTSGSKSNQSLIIHNDASYSTTSDVGSQFTDDGAGILIAVSGSQVPTASLTLSNQGSGGTTIQDSGGGGILLNNTTSLGGTIQIVDHGTTGITILAENAAAALTIQNNGSGGMTLEGSSHFISLHSSTAHITLDADSTGGLLQLQPSGQPTQISGHLNTNIGGGSNTTDFSGVVNITGSTTGTISYHANFTGTNAPLVVLTPTSDPTATGVYWVTPTGGTGAWTGFTVNVANSGTISFNYIVIGSQS